MNKYFYTDGKEKYGPFSINELKKQKITRNTKIWYYGIDNWTELSEVPELIDVLNSIPPEINLKFSCQDNISETEPTIKSEIKKQKKLNFPKKNKYSSLIRKLSIAIVVITVVSIFAYSLIQNQSEVNLYNEIAANSYESDESFDMYVEKFYRDLEFYAIYPKKPKIQIIKFSKLDQIGNTTHIHGLSYGINDDDRIEIYINPSTWRTFNKPMRYFLIYHELAHDVLNLDDLDEKSWNEGKLMYPVITSYENKNMDDFIESTHALFEEHGK